MDITTTVMMVKDVDKIRIHINNGLTHLDVNPWELVKLVTEDPLKDIDPHMLEGCGTLLGKCINDLEEYLDPKTTSVFVNKYPTYWKELREAINANTDPQPVVDVLWLKCQNRVLAAVLMHFAHVILTRPY